MRLRDSLNLFTIPLVVAVGAGNVWGVEAFLIGWPLTALVCLLLAWLEGDELRHEQEQK